MLLSDFKTLISTESDGIELKSIGDKCRLKYNWYYSYQLDNKRFIKFFILTKARSRPLIKYLQGNLKNFSDIRIYYVTPFFIKQYIKHGKIGKLNIRLDVKQIMGGRYFIPIFKALFGVSAHWREFEVLRVNNLVYISHKQDNTIFKILLHGGGYKAWINKEEIIFHGHAKGLIDRFFYNKINEVKKK